MTQILSQLGMSDPSASFGSNTLPNFNNVLGEWWLGGNSTDSMLNSITGVSGALIGAPTFSAGFATFSAGASGAKKGITTDIKVLGAVSIIALVRGVSNIGFVAAPAITNLNYQLITSGSNISMGNGHTAGATDQSILARETAPAFTFVMGVGLLGSAGRIFKVTAGGTVDDIGGQPYIPTTRPDEFLVLGSGGDVNNTGSVDVAAVAVINGAMTQSYAEEVYLMWKAYAESRGVTVA